MAIKKVKRKNGSFRYVTDGFEPSLTEQDHKDSANINKVIAKLAMNDPSLRFSAQAGSYSDITSIDYHAAMNIVANANSVFEELPAELRQKFATPDHFLDWIQNPKNGEEIIAYGLGELVDPQEPTSFQADGVQTAGSSFSASEDLNVSDGQIDPKSADNSA